MNTNKNNDYIIVLALMYGNNNRKRNKSHGGDVL